MRRTTPTRLDGANADQHLEVGVLVVELGRRQLLGRQTVQERHGGEHVSIGDRLDMRRGKGAREQAMRRLGGEAPVLSPVIDSLSATDAVDPAAGGQQHAILPEHARQMSKSGLDVDDHLQRLGTDDAIEALGRHIVRAREIGHDRRLWVARDDVQYIALRHASSSELARVPVVADLEHATADVLGVRGEEPLDVVPVDGEAAVEAERPAHRSETPQAAEVDVPAARPLKTVAMALDSEPATHGGWQAIGDHGADRSRGDYPQTGLVFYSLDSRHAALDA